MLDFRKNDEIGSVKSVNWVLSNGPINSLPSGVGLGSVSLGNRGGTSGE